MIYSYYPQWPHNYRYELNKDMHLSAAHYIPSEDAGKCRRVHGHTYTINVTVVGDELNRNGFLIDFTVLKKWIHKRYDHTLLNDHPEFASEETEAAYPTTEVVAQVIWKTVQQKLDETSNKPKCLQVLVRETPTSYAVFRPKEGDFA
ncbi:preQ(0) biosynthesis protein QueD [Marinococcus luteus]|uniref:6-carboxy-5,6,7,8-tetrahydropterin synthase n=1 Tax=Marinococcus luteus TaxID=1122204 RepID=A0A1H2VFC0_9BACI|nr:6-carboxytetrahydropterin synthase QueD [Marinococcus luteus]SDW66992.1 preQ(0) biosynthesis protein QueD [Marinococcus luteus]